MSTDAQWNWDYTRKPRSLLALLEAISPAFCLSVVSFWTSVLKNGRRVC